MTHFHEDAYVDRRGDYCLGAYGDGDKSSEDVKRSMREAIQSFSDVTPNALNDLLVDPSVLTTEISPDIADTFLNQPKEDGYVVLDLTTEVLEKMLNGSTLQMSRVSGFLSSGERRLVLFGLHTGPTRDNAYFGLVWKKYDRDWRIVHIELACQ